MSHSHDAGATARPAGAGPLRKRPAACQALDPCTLGRPVHLLQKFSTLLREDLTDLFRQRLNRRYQADFRVDDVRVDASGKTPPPGRWMGYATANGRVACALDRLLVLSALVYRYGLKDGNNVGAPHDLPETATEERLAAMLGRQLADALAARVERGLKAGSEAAPAAIESTFLGSVAAPAGACLITATVSERIHRIEGRIQLTLDDAGTACLLRHLASTQRRRAPARAHPTPLKSRLHFRLVARLLQKDLTLGELLDIGVGDLIPVSLRAADVLIDDSRLMTATVAEHKGKLCLTNFEDVN